MNEEYYRMVSAIPPCELTTKVPCWNTSTKFQKERKQLDEAIRRIQKSVMGMPNNDEITKAINKVKTITKTWRKGVMGKISTGTIKIIGSNGSFIYIDNDEEGSPTKL